MILIDPYVNFLIEHNITQEQLLLLTLLYEKRIDLIKRYKDKFPTEDGSMIGEYQTNNLIDMEFLMYNEKGNLELGRKFLEIFVDKHRATEEIFEIYPTFFNKEGIAIPLSAMDRNKFANMYQDAIMGSFEEHQEIIKDIQYGKEKNLLNIGIEKFLKAQYWKQIRKSRIKNIEVQTKKTKIDNEF